MASNFPHSSTMSTSFGASSYNTQSNLEALIAKARASSSPTQPRRASASSPSVTSNPSANRFWASTRSGGGAGVGTSGTGGGGGHLAPPAVTPHRPSVDEETALLLDDSDAEIRDRFDEQDELDLEDLNDGDIPVHPSKDKDKDRDRERERDRERVRERDGRDRSKSGSHSTGGAGGPVGSRLNIRASPILHPHGQHTDRARDRRRSSLSSDKQKHLGRLTTIQSGALTPTGDRSSSPKDGDRSRSRSRSISRTRLASGQLPGFSEAGTLAAASTLTGIRLPQGIQNHQGSPFNPGTQIHMTADPATELDPLIDLEIPDDPENPGKVTKHWRKAAWTELRVLVKSAVPVFFSQLAEYSLQLASVISVGHLSTTDLAASSLASMTSAVCAYSLIQGLASALDTLLPSAWTSSRPELVGIWVQRMCIVMAISIIPMLAILLQAEPILLFLGQEPEVAARAALYLRYLCISLPGYSLNQIMKKYFQSQSLMTAPTIVITIVAPINIILNYLLVWGPDPIRLGFIGAPLSTAISFNLAAIISVAYAAFVAPQTAWGGFSKEAFLKLGTVTSLGMAGMVMVSSEWWAWEVCALAASQLGPIPLAAQSILLSTGSVLYQVPASLGISASVRVGNLLGAGQAFEAQNAARAALGLSVFMSGINSTLMIVGRHRLAYIYNNDPEVVALVGKLAIYVALFQVTDGLVGTSGGVLRAVGKQSAGALINLTAYYVLGLPIGIYLCFSAKLGLAGLWLGLTLSLAYAAVASCIIILRLKWDHAVDKARERLGLGHLMKDGEVEEGEVVRVNGYGTMSH